MRTQAVSRKLSPATGGRGTHEKDSTIYFGIDPGLRNIGFAMIMADGKEYTRVLVPADREELLQDIWEWLYMETPGVLGLEDYTFFGTRKNFGPMKELIGTILGMAFALDVKAHLFQPREKAKVSSRLDRPKGQTDHEFDARCLAHLARDWYNMEGTRWDEKPPSGEPKPIMKNSKRSSGGHSRRP